MIRSGEIKHFRNTCAIYISRFRKLEKNTNCAKSMLPWDVAANEVIAIPVQFESIFGATRVAMNVGQILGTRDARTDEPRASAVVVSMQAISKSLLSFMFLEPFRREIERGEGELFIATVAALTAV